MQCCVGKRLKEKIIILAYENHRCPKAYLEDIKCKLIRFLPTNPESSCSEYLYVLIVGMLELLVDEHQPLTWTLTVKLRC